MKFQDIVRCKRRELGLTQEQAARRLGVSPAAVSKWESGQSLPDTPLFAPLARLLHTDLNTLRSFEEEPEPARVAQLLNEVARLLQAEGYEAAFAYAMDVLREYPSCDMLAYGFAASLLGGLELAPPAQGRETFEAELDSLLERAAGAGDAGVRVPAQQLLINRCIQKRTRRAPRPCWASCRRQRLSRPSSALPSTAPKARTGRPPACWRGFWRKVRPTCRGR